MSLDKGIVHRKELRKPYRGIQAFDRGCRCHGGCGHCLSNRLHSFRMTETAAEQDELDELGYVARKHRPHKVTA